MAKLEAKYSDTFFRIRCSYCGTLIGRMTDLQRSFRLLETPKGQYLKNTASHITYEVNNQDRKSSVSNTHQACSSRRELLLMVTRRHVCHTSLSRNVYKKKRNYAKAIYLAVYRTSPLTMILTLTDLDDQLQLYEPF